MNGGLYTLAIVGVLSSVVSAYYYLRIIKLMYFDQAEEALDRGMAREVGWVTAATALVIALFFIYPEPLLASAAAAASSLFGG